MQINDEIKKYIDIAGVMYVMLSGEGKVVLVNKTTSDLLGYSEEELVGKNWFDLVIPEKMRYQVKDVFAKLMRGEVENVEKHENEVVVKNGERRTISWHNSLRLDKEGNAIGTVSAGEDITKSKEARQALSEAHTIINRSLMVAFLWKNESDWPVEFVSENVEKLTGYSSREFMEGEILYSQIIHPDDLKMVEQEVMENSSKNELMKFEHKPYRIITKNKDVKWIDDNTYVRRNTQGEITHYEGIVFDITENREIREELEKRMDEMEKLNKLMVGRELKMIEMKKSLRQFNEAQPNKSNTSETHDKQNRKSTIIRDKQKKIGNSGISRVLTKGVDEK